MTDERLAYRSFINYLQKLAEVDSPSALARRAGFWPSTVNKVLGDKPVKHKLTSKTIEGLAKAAGLTADEAHALLSKALRGEDLRPRSPADEERGRRVPIVGYVGAGALVHKFEGDTSTQYIDEADAPPGSDENTEAVIVRGDSMAPAFRDHDTIYYRRVRRPIESLIGRECVVGLATGEVYVKMLQRGSSPGLFNLFSYNAPSSKTSPSSGR